MSRAQDDGAATISSVMPTYHFKIVLLGEAAVGKSCLVVRFAKNRFFAQQEPTIGAAFMAQVVQVNGANIRLEIWDTAGSERYRSVASMYYRHCFIPHVIPFQSSFEGAQHWVNELHAKHSADILIVLVGNKIDMDDHRVVETQETSAKTGERVMDVFKEIGSCPSFSITRVMLGGHSVATQLPMLHKVQDTSGGFQLLPKTPQDSPPFNTRIWSCCFGQ